MRRYATTLPLLLIPYAIGCSSREQPRTYAFPREETDAHDRIAGSSLRVLHLIERQAFALADEEINALEDGTDLEREVAAILSRWLEARRRTTRVESTVEAARATAERHPERLPSDAVRLKNEGLNHYSAGRLDEAIRCWNAALEASPGDPEIEKFLDRAREVLQNCGEARRTSPPAPLPGN